MGLTDDNSMFPRGACDPKWRGRAEKAEARVRELEAELKRERYQVERLTETNSRGWDENERQHAEITLLSDRVAELEAAQTPRPMSEDPGLDVAVWALVPVIKDLGVWAYAPEDEDKPLRFEDADGWLPLPDREESKAEPGNQPDREDEKA